MYIKRSFGMPTTLKKGARTLEECQRLCRRESTCTGIQHDGSCELLVDPHCDFSESFKEETGQWTVMSRPAFDPELRRDAAKAVAPLPPVPISSTLNGGRLGGAGGLLGGAGGSISGIGGRKGDCGGGEMSTTHAAEPICSMVVTFMLK